MRGLDQERAGGSLSPQGSSAGGGQRGKRKRRGVGVRTTLSRDAQHTLSWEPAACVSLLCIPVLGHVEKGLNRWVRVSPASGQGLLQVPGQTSGPEVLLTDDLAGCHPGALGPMYACCHL